MLFSCFRLEVSTTLDIRWRRYSFHCYRIFAYNKGTLRHRIEFSIVLNTGGAFMSLRLHPFRMVKPMLKAHVFVGIKYIDD